MTVRRSMWVGAVLLATLAVLGAQPALAQSQGTPDENLRIANLWYAIDLFAQLWTMPVDGNESVD